MKALWAAAVLAAAPVSAAQWRVDPQRSAIAFESAQAGTAIKGRFTRWNAAIAFDPDKPAAARVDVRVALASAATGDGSVDNQLPTADWFNIAGGAVARFQAAGFTVTGPGRYLARGTLSLRGVSVPVQLPFTLAVAGDIATMRGTTRLDRRAFRIGMEADAAATWVPFAVPLTVTVVAKRLP